MSLGVIENVFGAYPNRTYVFASLVLLKKVMVRFLVGCNLFWKIIYYFVWSKISFKFFAYYSFCWLLNCLVSNYCIIIDLYWNFSTVVIKKLYVACIQTIYADLLAPQACVRSWHVFRLCGCTFHHQLIVLFQLYHTYFFLVIVVCVFLSMKE